MIPPNRALILAAGRGARLGSLGERIPKGLIEINGEPLVGRSISMLKAVGIENITLVVGHRAEAYRSYLLDDSGLEFRENLNFATSGSFASFVIGDSVESERVLCLDSDIIFDKKALESAVENANESFVLTCGSPSSSGDEVWAYSRESRLVGLSKDLTPEPNLTRTEFIGISMFGGAFLNDLRAAYIERPETWFSREYEEAVSFCARNREIAVVEIDQLTWAEIDTEAHLAYAKGLFE